MQMRRGINMSGMTPLWKPQKCSPTPGLIWGRNASIANAHVAHPKMGTVCGDDFATKTLFIELERCFALAVEQKIRI
jgi:hypothetical protein